MKFVVTSVSGEELAEPLRVATRHIEKWLSAALGGADFGPGLDQITVVVVSVDDDIGENARWAKGHNKLGRFTSQVTSAPVRHLSFAAQLPPSIASSLPPTDLLARIAGSIRVALATRPVRLPREFAYDRFSKAADAALQAYVGVA